MLGQPEGPDDLYSLMSEADRVRISYQLLLKMKLEKQLKTKTKTMKELSLNGQKDNEEPDWQDK